MKSLVAPGQQVRYPTIQVLVAGTYLSGAVSAEVQSNSHYQADTLHLQLALNAPGGHDLTWWGSDGRVNETYEVKLGLDGALTSLIVGDADKIEIDVARGTVDITGRDLTSRFIDNRTQESFQNKTSSEIATILAQRRGLTPKVTDTTTPATRYYQDDHDRVSHDQFSSTGTEWDLLSFLAQREAFDVFVQGTTLYFQPRTDPTKAEPYGIHWNQQTRTGDVIDIKCERSLTLAKDVVVQVRSWESRKGASFTKTSPASASAVKTGKAQRFVYTFPNLTQDQAQKRADAIRADITKHERDISFSIPGELALTPRDILQLFGCGGWDQQYFVNTITRRVSVEGGFEENVTAKNHSPESDAATP